MGLLLCKILVTFGSCFFSVFGCIFFLWGGLLGVFWLLGVRHYVFFFFAMEWIMLILMVNWIVYELILVCLLL